MRKEAAQRATESRDAFPEGIHHAVCSFRILKTMPTQVSRFNKMIDLTALLKHLSAERDLFVNDVRDYCVRRWS